MPNASTAGAAAIDVELSNTATARTIWVQGVEGVTGTATITASTTGFTSGTATITVVQPELQFADLPEDINVDAPNLRFFVRTGISRPGGGFLLRPARTGGGGFPVTVASSNATVARLVTNTGTNASVSVEVAENEFQTAGTVADGGVAFDALSPGTTTITASSSAGATPASQNVAVSGGSISIANDTIGARLQIQMVGRLPTGGHAGVTVRLESSSPGRVLLSRLGNAVGSAAIDVPVGNGSTTFVFYVQGVEGATGTVTITAFHSDRPARPAPAPRSRRPGGSTRLRGSALHSPPAGARQCCARYRPAAGGMAPGAARRWPPSRRDRAAYLSHYLRGPRLARTGASGVQYGYDGLAAGDPDAWPDTLVASHFEAVPVAPGVVYGAYRYRAVDGGSQRGVSERVLVRQPDGSWKVAVSTAFGSPGDRPVPAFALTGATIVDGTGAPPRVGTVVMRDGKIACIGACTIGADVEAIDARGEWIIPGLVDAHVHFSQTGWADGRPDALDLRERFPYDSTVAELERDPERFGRSYLCAGVTAVFDVGGYPWTWALRERAEASNAMPRVAAAGPLLSTRDHWLNLPAARQFIHLADEASTRAGARFIAAHGSDAVKVWYLVNESSPDTAAHKTNLRAAAEEARKTGLPLIVHATSLWAAKDAVRAGARLLVHSVEDRPVDEEFLRLARRVGTIYTPTLTVREGYIQLRERRFVPQVSLECVDPVTRRKAFLTDSIGGGRVDPEFNDRIAAGYRTMQENLQRVHRAGIPVVTGSDAGNPLTLHGPAVLAEMAAMADAGLTPMEVLVASTRNAARAMGRDDFGTIEPGKLADLVVLDADPLADISNARRVRLVVRGGEVWTREELEYRE